MALDNLLIEQEYPGATMVEPMLIWSLPKHKKDMLPEVCQSGKYFGQIKKDGYFYSLNKSLYSEFYLFSRNKSVTNGLLSEKINNVPFLKEGFNNIPKDTVIIGEIYKPNGTSKDVTKYMGCLPDKAVQRQEQDGRLHFYIHDIIKFDGIDLKSTSAYIRYLILEKIFYLYGLDKYDYIELAETHTNNLEDRISAALADGEEGMVLKHKESLYYPDKRPAWETIKVKQSDSADVVVMDLMEPTKEYTGTELDTWQYFAIEKMVSFKQDSVYIHEEFCEVGKESRIRSPLYRTIPVTKGYYYGWKTAIKIGAYNEKGELVEIGTVSSGLTDDLKSDFGKNPDKYIGKIAEINCMSLDKDSKTIRHPYFVRFRDDKNKKDCTIKNIF